MKSTRFAAIAAASFVARIAAAQTPPPAATPAPTPTPAGGYEQMSLEDLLNVPISVATKTAIPFRETPGVITLVTHDQILASGARDLVDVLKLVPGFQFGVDIEGFVAVSFRGNWVEEGKELVLIDGQEMNDLLYLNFGVGEHLPVDQIDRIEIIRGPGSVLYGGSAELAVINIVTRGGAGLSGGRAAVTYGSTAKTFMRRNLELAYGQAPKSEGGFTWSLSGMVADGKRSDAIYNDLYQTGSDTYDMAGHSGLRDGYVNAGIAFKGFSARYLLDDYTVQNRDAYDVIFPYDDYKQYITQSFGAQYDAKVSDTLTITPRISYKRNSAWRDLGKLDPTTYYDPMLVRYLGELTANWQPSTALNVLAGATTYQDDYWIQRNNTGESQGSFLHQLIGGALMADNSWDPPKVFVRRVNGNIAGFAQAIWNNPIANVELGARYDHNSQFGDSFEPRAALTKVFDPFHVKLLASRAFRPPALGNLDYNENLKPEHATALEAEVGWRANDQTYLSANVFDVTVDKPIVYTSAVNGTGGYFNYAHTGTRGFELTANTQLQDLHLQASYSLYDAAGKNAVVDYAVPGRAGALVGSAQQKVAVNATYPLWHAISLGLTGVYYGQRYGYDQYDATNGVLVVGHEPAVFLADVLVSWRQPVKNMDAWIGVFNAMNERFQYLEGYDGAHPPLPAEPREVAAHVSYSF